MSLGQTDMLDAEVRNMKFEQIPEAVRRPPLKRRYRAHFFYPCVYPIYYIPKQPRFRVRQRSRTLRIALAPISLEAGRGRPRCVERPKASRSRPAIWI